MRKPPKTDADLVAAGWERRSMLEPTRAQEMAEVYESAGFEVKLVPLAPLDFSPDCGTCAETISKDYLVVYTKKDGRTPTSSPPNPDSFQV